MLAQQTLAPHAGPTYRLADARDEVAAAREHGIAEHEIGAIVDFLRQRVGRSGPSDIVNGPFWHRTPGTRPFGYPGRFHDGTWPCLYTALEAETARAEMAYHAGRRFRRPDGRVRDVHYKLVGMVFNGQVFDLRGREETWPDLVGPDEASYPFCQRLAHEARERGADGLLTTSARRAAGTCLPVFERRSVDRSQILDVVVITV